jgi:hypothetical protein
MIAAENIRKIRKIRVLMTAALIGWRREIGLYGRMGLKLGID